MRDTKTWNVQASCYAKNTFNPIRNIVENLKIVPHPDKPMIALSIGDPTIFGNLKLAEEITEAVVESVRSGKHNGYGPSTGSVAAKEAIAEYCSTPESPVKLEDVIICSGCSSALDICITALCSPGQNILVPRPGFPLYQTLAEGLDIPVKQYDLLPDKNWEVDIKMMENLVDEKTAAIVVNNPSNPCGSVFNRNHLNEIIQVAARKKVPIIADEIYDNFVFDGQEFSWMASLSTEVPILSCGGLTKRFLVPGWRTGWITIHDRNQIFEKEIRKGLQSLSQRIIGSNTLVQGAIPKILKETPKEFFRDTLKVVQANSRLSHEILNSVKGLQPIMPQGAMYMMVRIDMDHFPAFENDLQFVERMISEESVFCLPGKCFNIANFVRIVLTVPEEQMKESCLRIKNFCDTHYTVDAKPKTTTTAVTNGYHHQNITKQHMTTTNGTTTTIYEEDNYSNRNDVILNDKTAAILKREIIAGELEAGYVK